ncbi:9826_t:CDS:2 [Dentiscutata heterogama]|uniref:9826_t:CDS:1 n=1 Tax=Dentiscutata heterogama TaxID=1316150 RepID=A0ACA9K1B8_9GLOM|nr:9826_t:CDS:2 [Dentiscutata heterogama]
MSRLIFFIPFKIILSELINLTRLFHIIIYHRTHLFLLLCILTFTSLDPVNATLLLYDSSNIELASLTNTDFPFLDSLNNNPLSNYYKNGVVIEGRLEIAKFNVITNDDNFTINDGPCTLRPIPVGIDLLVVPFDVIQRFGCNFIDDFISRNIWITNGIMSPSGSNQSSLPDGSTILPNGTIAYSANNVGVKSRNENNGQCKYFISKSSYERRSINRNSLQNQKRVNIHKRDVSFNINDLLPKVIAFTSLNGGDPGVKELIYNRDLLRNASVGLTLLRKDDTTLIQSLYANIDHIKLTSNISPWVLLLQSSSWAAWSIVWRNLNIVILPAISFCSLASSIILQIDPNGIREDRLSITSYKFIIGLRFASLCIFYIMLQFLWVKAAREITRYDTRLLPFIRIFSNVQRLILYTSILIILISTFLKILNQPSTNSQLLNSSVILEIIFIVIVNLGYFVFGIIMIWGLATSREIHQRIGENLIYKFSNKGDKWKAGRITEDLSTCITLSSFLFLLRVRKFSWFLVKPTSILLANLKLDKKDGKGMLYPSVDEEDERINSAAYTTRIAVVRPEPTYRMNPNRIDVDLQFGNYTVRDDNEKIMNNRNRFLEVDRESLGEKNIIKDKDLSKGSTKSKPNNGSNGNGGKSESNKFDIIDL